MARTRSRRPARFVAGAVGLVLVGSGLVAAATPALADHLADVTVTQSGNTFHSVTLRLDITITGGCCRGTFYWTTGDGATGTLEDAVSGGQFVSDPAGQGFFDSDRPAAPPGVDMTSYTYRRDPADPTTNTQSTYITYNYAGEGSYPVTWNHCCAVFHGALTVVVAPIPFYPTGTVEISGDPTGVGYRYSNFTPGLAGWTIAVTPWNGSTTTVTLTPPAAPAGTVNVCNTLTVFAEEPPLLGNTTGTSACAGGPRATAVANPLTGRNAAVASPQNAFAWTCAASLANPALAVTWRVRCTVNS